MIGGIKGLVDILGVLSGPLKGSGELRTYRCVVEIYFFADVSCIVSFSNTILIFHIMVEGSQPKFSISIKDND